MLTVFQVKTFWQHSQNSQHCTKAVFASRNSLVKLNKFTSGYALIPKINIKKFVSFAVSKLKQSLSIYRNNKCISKYHRLNVSTTTLFNSILYFWTLHKKWSFPLKIFSVNVTKIADLVTFAEKSLMENFIFCSVPIDAGRKLNVLDVFWTSYVRSIYVLCLRGNDQKQGILFDY